METLDDVRRRGGALACIESGWFAQQLSDSAYQHALDVDTGARTVIGVNQFRTPPEPLEVFAVDPAMEAGSGRGRAVGPGRTRPARGRNGA